ncbi:MAG: hypothetical protein ACI9TH_001343 [Kiritimatiellia bacterium]|jgi:hypothetical protein
MKISGHIGIALGVLGAQAALLKWAAEPFLYGGFSTAALSLLALLCSSPGIGRKVWYNLGMCGLIIGGAETWLKTAPMRADDQPHTYFEGSYTYNYMDVHDILGYGPRLRGTVNSRKMFEKEVVYDATYTILKSGLRNAGSNETAEQSMVFFGGSYMFGEGVDDKETLPYAMQERLQKPWAMYNFGFHGYGPHQMVAALQSEMVAETVKAPPAHIFYMTAGFHIGRPSGVSQLNGPAYYLDTKGRIKRDGFFEDEPHAPSAWVIKLKNQTDKSRIYQRLTKPRYLQGDREFALYMALLREARDLAAKQYPDAQFHVILWRMDNEGGDRVYEQLTQEKFTIHVVGDALDPDRDRDEYKLGEHDGHPNAIAFSALAAYLVDEVIEPATETPPR